MPIHNLHFSLICSYFIYKVSFLNTYNTVTNERKWQPTHKSYNMEIYPVLSLFTFYKFKIEIKFQLWNCTKDFCSNRKVWRTKKTNKYRIEWFIRKSPETHKTIQAIVIAFDYPTYLEGKMILLMIPYALVSEWRNLSLTGSLHTGQFL